jgi:hypothetical protein
MPGVDVNRQMFGERYDWPERGGEWSAPWGGVATQCYASIVPRLHPFLPARRVLEIAPGFGRWSNFLIPTCESYVGVDLSEPAVDACRKRFADASHASFFVNDGRSLQERVAWLGIARSTASAPRRSPGRGGSARTPWSRSHTSWLRWPRLNASPTFGAALPTARGPTRSRPGRCDGSGHSRLRSPSARSAHGRSRPLNRGRVGDLVRRRRRAK